MKKRVLILLLTSLVTFSCEYETADIYLKEIGKPDPNIEIKINLTEIQPEEIIYIYQPTWLYFGIDVQGMNFYDITIFLDRELLDAGWNGFLINPAEFDNSIHDLTLLRQV